MGQKQKENAMNIDDLTIGEAKRLAAMFGANVPAQFVTPHIGKRCIVRTYASGVFCAEVVAHDGRMVELKNSRRLWTWKAVDGISLSAVAVSGVDPAACRFPVQVLAQTILDALEIIPATDAALATIDACKNAAAQ
jgi:hypothetical protein